LSVKRQFMPNITVLNKTRMLKESKKKDLAYLFSP